MDGEEGSEKRSLSDAARDVIRGFRDTRPDFLSNKDKKNSKRRNGSDGVAGGLRSAEQSAVNDGIGASASGLGGVRDKETKVGGLYSGSGKTSGGVGGKSGKSKKKTKGWFKKGGPIGLVIGLIVSVGGIVGGAQLLQPFSLVAQFQETFNSMHVSASKRSNALIRYQMDNKLVKDPIKSKIFTEDTFKISKNQASKLSVYGIEYDDDFDGNGTRVLKYDDGSGEIKIIAADDAAASRLSSMDLSRFDTDNIKYNTEAVSFRNFYESDTSFFRSYNNGSMTWRGTIANWFGTTTMNFLKGNNLTRNLFKNFDQDVAESDKSPREVATDLIAKQAGDTIEEGGVRVATTEEDEEGNPVRVADEDGNYRSVAESGKSTTSRSRIQSDSEVKAKLEEIGNKYSGGSVTGTAQKIVNSACIGLNFLGGVSLLVSASEALQIINLTTSFFEAIDKVKAGDGDNSPIHTLVESLNEKKVNTNVDLAVKSGASISTSDMGANVTENGVSALEPKYTTTDKTAMESSGITSLYSGKRVNPDDPSVKSFNFTSSIKRVLGGIGTSMAAFRTCSFAKLAANFAGAVQSGVEIAACIAGLLGAPFTLGGTAAAGCSGLIADAVVGAAFSVGISLLIAGIISTITPVVAKMLTRDLITNLGGEDLGNALTSGGNMYLGNTHRANGGSLATESEYVKYALAHQQVIAEDARQERLVRDPFDATSKYTFLGTLLTQMMAFSPANSLTSFISSTSSVMSSAVVAALPTASAYNVADDLVPMQEYENTCPYLASIGAVGDAYCNPYSMTDLSTIQSDPSEVTNILDDNFLDTTTSDGNVKIDGDSDLAKYILFCDNRSSAFGIADQNIVNQVSDWGQVDTGSSTFNNVINSAIGSVPVVGDFIDVVGNAEALANAGYVGGESCVAGNTVSDAQAPNWDKAKYYQRFIEDQSLMEGMGIIEKSAVTAFLDDYYEKNPLDNSYEGILARYSGLDKDTVVALLDIVDYGNYIASYNPNERYAFGEPAVEVEKELKFDNENTVADNLLVILFNPISYADVRNRSFAA